MSRNKYLVLTTLLCSMVLLLAFIPGIPSHALAQISPECSDRNDNDKDGKIDADDPQCKVQGGVCEDGTTNCMRNPAATGGAQANNPAATGGTNITPSTQTTDIPLKIKLNNPLGSKAKDIQDVIKLFMDVVVKIAIPFIVVFFIWSGLQFILAQGNPEKIKKAKAMFWGTVIGTLLILGAWAITDAIVGTINSIAS